MEFRLTYQGLLLSDGASGSRTVRKHEIRRHFHHQLKEYWGIHPFLRLLTINDRSGRKAEKSENTLINVLASRYTRSNGYRFLPLVRAELSVLCSLEILYLRPQQPGSLISGPQGDIDNRLKTLFDALAAPGEGKQVPESPPQEGEDPFYCLLEDDRLVTHVSVQTDYLLMPTLQQPDINDSRIVITVRLKPFTMTMGMLGNSGFA
ncbi:hypothetical protein [Dongia sedimenti]|uniref:Uncharacterized protein n=1 Tax=Dongia sedimenti TaxID=3064282 RepID=A0ABU0YVD4_9PROT|nr:hypothetical protein [Rhodospirillaceae bacterium R-7]